MSDNGDPKGKRKQFFNKGGDYKKRKTFILEEGIKGFVCTCNFRERDTVKEAYNLLNKYADKMYGEEHPQKEDASDKEDIEESLANELKQLHSQNEQPRKKRFQVVESGAKNCIFIRTTVEDPIKLATNIIDDIILSGKQQTRFLIRLLPIAITCKAKLDDVKLAFKPLIDQYFGGEPLSFSIVYNHRNNNKFPKDDFIQQIAEMVHEKNDGHKVNLKEAEISVVLEVIRGHACLSIIPNYLKYKKCNLHTICGSEDDNKDLKDENVEDSENKESANAEENAAKTKEEVEEIITLDTKEVLKTTKACEMI